MTLATFRILSGSGVLARKIGKLLLATPRHSEVIQAIEGYAAHSNESSSESRRYNLGHYARYNTGFITVRGQGASNVHIHRRMLHPHSTGGGSGFRNGPLLHDGNRLLVYAWYMLVW